jgi:hypothetical protein
MAPQQRNGAQIRLRSKIADHRWFDCNSSSKTTQRRILQIQYNQLDEFYATLGAKTPISMREAGCSYLEGRIAWQLGLNSDIGQTDAAVPFSWTGGQRYLSREIS